MKIPIWAMACMLAFTTLSASQKSSAEEFLERMDLNGVTAILDVGCGDGNITAALARTLPRAEIIGIDQSHSMIAFAQELFSDRENLTFSVQDAAKINYNRQFDLITSVSAMQWIFEQRQALLSFKKALKPGGRLYIQMPTGLPTALDQALSELLRSEKWASYFTEFRAPWRFYEEEEYAQLLSEAHLTPTRLETFTKQELFPSRSEFHGFLQQWFPYLRPLPVNLKNLFLTELLDAYLKILPVDEQGRVSFIVTRLEIEATK